MNYKEIYRKKDLSGAFLFSGKEKLLMENTCTYLINLFTKEAMRSFNLIYFKAEECSLANIEEACQTFPLMDKKKIVIVKDSLNFINLNNLEKSFYDFLDNLPDFIILIFLERDAINKTTKFYKYFSKKGTNVDFAKLTPQEVSRFVNSYFLRKNKKIKPAQISYFLSLTSYNLKNSNVSLLDLKNEMDKIIGFSKDEFINNSDIDLLTDKVVDANIFKLLDGLYARDRDFALNELKNLYDDNEPMAKIFVMIVRQVRLLLAYKVLKNKNSSSSDIMNKLSIKKFEFSKLQNYSSNFKMEFLRDFYDELLKSDRILKSTNIDPLLEMENLIIKYTRG